MAIKYYYTIIILLLLSLQGTAQKFVSDHSWWNELHDWNPGDPGWRNWIIISPGYLGPNALPVPHVQKGILKNRAEIEFAFSNHFHQGDPTRDVSGYLFIPFAKSRIAVEMYGVLLEQFAFSEEIRNERFARNKEGKGFATGDFYFSTLLQVIKDRKFPNTLLRFATKTTSGSNLESARYSDDHAMFVDLSFSKSWGNENSGVIRPFAMAGFYTWQTNDEDNLQNDAPLYGLGVDVSKKRWGLSTAWSGYSGYKNQRDKPMQLTIDLTRELGDKALRLQYIHGLRDWEYKTVRISFVWKLNIPN